MTSLTLKASLYSLRLNLLVFVNDVEDSVYILQSDDLVPELSPGQLPVTIPEISWYSSRSTQPSLFTHTSATLKILSICFLSVKIPLAFRMAMYSSMSTLEHRNKILIGPILINLTFPSPLTSALRNSRSKNSTSCFHLLGNLTYDVIYNSILSLPPFLSCKQSNVNSLTHGPLCLAWLYIMRAVYEAI